jgi:hypothetical protein
VFIILYGNNFFAGNCEKILKLVVVAMDDIELIG